MKKSIFLFFAAILCAMNANAWSLMGEVTDWGTGKEMTGDSKVVSVTVNLQANKTLKLKIKNGDTWYGNAGTMTSDNNLVWGFSDSAGDASIQTTDAGDYTFTWYIDDKTLSVTYPNHNYIVAGDGDVMEDNWSPSSTKNKMVKQDDGTYRLIKTNRNLSATTYGYKLTVGSWSVNQYPNDNVALEVTTAGNYNVVFTYNPKNGQLSHELVPIYTITASANPATAGTITGAGTYAKDASVTIEATPNAGYKFVNWTVGGVEKSTETTYSFTASADVTAVANFELSDPEVPTYAISVSANDDAMGTVTGAGDYTEGSPVTLTATPKAGYQFKNWTVAGAEVSTANPYTFTANEDVTVTANFEELPKETVYFINTPKWTSVNAYAYNSENTNWPGVAATKEAEKIGEHEVYSYTAIQGKHKNVIFNDGSGAQTADLDWTAGKYYIHDYQGTTGWKTKEEAEALLVTSTPEPVETTTVYFINAEDWTGTIYAYAFADGGSTKNAGWPGEVAQKEANQIGGHDVYSYTAEKGKYETVIFNNNSDKQTSDMTWTADQYLCKNEWCADEAAVLAKLNGPVEYVSVYFINTVDWSAVNIYTWSPEVAKWPGVAMTKEAEQIAGFDVYSYTVEKGTTFGGMKFNAGNEQPQTGDLQWTAGKYYIYNYGSVIGWFTKEEAIAKLTEPVVTYDYYIAGNEALLGVDKNWGSTPAGKGMDKGADGLYTATFTLSANTEYEFKITDGQWNSEGDNSHEHTTLAAVYVGVTGGNGNNIKVNLAEAKELTITFNSTEDKIYFNLDEETASLTYTVKVPEGTEACFIAGPCGDWSFREMTREGETDIFKIEITGAKETDEYKYACQADWAYAEVIEGGGNRTEWQELDQVEEWGKPVIVTYQLKGVGGWDKVGIELVQNPNPGKASEYMLTCQAISATDAIKVVRLENGEIKDYYGNGTVKDEVTVAVSYDDEANIKLPAGTYNFYFDTNASEKKLWIEAATDCETEPTTVTLTYDLTTDAVSNKMGRRYVTAEDATLGNVQIILPSFNTETTEYTDASLVVGDETLGATATYTADTDNNKETYTATATSEDGTTTYNVTMTIIVPATQTYTFIATIGAEATVNEYEWGTEYSINGSGYLDDTPVEFELLADNMGFLSGTINGVDVYCSDATTNTENELGETYLSVMATAQDAVGNTYNIQMWVLIVVEKVEIVITEEIDVTLGNLKLEPMGNMAIVTADNLSFWMTLLETENYYGTYESDMFSNIWYGGDDDAIQLQAYGEGIYTSNALTVSFISEPDAEGNATKYNFTLTRKTITLTTDDNSAVIAANIDKTVNVKIERSFTANDGYYTLCVPFNMPASVIGKAYSLGTITEHVSGEGININLEEESELSAGVPYLVLPKANMSELVVENVTIQSDIASGQNIYSEELNVNIFFEGFYSAPAAPENQTNGTTQYYVGDNGYLYNDVVEKRGLCGLFTITDKNGEQIKVRARVVTREEVETGIDNNQLPNTNIQKVLENGQLIIIREGVKYNVQGQVIK